MTEKNNLPDNPEMAAPPAGEEDLGIAGRTAATFIASPVTPLLMMAFLCFGLLGLLFTPRQEDPKITVPMVDIFVQYPGASAPQVATLVTEPLERIMSEIPGVRHVYSGTQRGRAMVTVRFKVGEDMEDSILKVHDKLMSNLDRMPPGVERPLVKPVSIDDVPIVTVTLWSKDVDDAALRALGLDVLQRLGEVPNTGKGFVVGGRAEQIRVEVLPERLSGFGISVDQVANTIRTANAEQEAGNVERGGTAFSVYTGAFLRTADEVARLVIGVHEGAPIYVRDVARVYQGPEETRRIVSYYSGPSKPEGESEAWGAPAVTVAIAKKLGTNGVTVANDILAKLEELKGSLIPGNVQVSITRNYGKSANDKVNELLGALFDAAFAVSVLCLIGLGLRAAFVVITVIPIVVLVTIWAAWVLDYTIDRVSLFALVFSIGILVDDAAVLVENIFRRWLLAGETTGEIAIDAVREVGNPTILATFTIIAALLPMGFVSGLMGPYMLPIPVLGSVAMLFSLFAAFMFTPWLAMRVRPQLSALQKASAKEHKVQERISAFYRPIILPLIEKKFLGRLFLIGLILTTFWACSLFYTKTVTVKMLPFDNKPEFNVIINMPEGTALPVTANVAHQLAEALRTIPEVKSLQTYVGTASPFNFNGMVRHYYLRKEPWEADIQVLLRDKHERERSSHELAVAARHLITPIARKLGARIQVVEMPPGPPVLQTVVAEVHGPSPEVRRKFARDLTAMFEEVENIVDVDNYLTEPYEYWRFEVDTEKAVRRGISIDAINRNLAMALGGYVLGDVKRGVVLEPTYIVIQVPLASRSDVHRLRNLPIATPGGGTIPLAELGRFVRAQEDPTIYHKDLRAVEYVTGEMEGRLGAPIYGMFGVEDLLEEYVAPDGVKVSGMPMGLIGPPESDNVSGIEWSGEWTVTYETFRDMGIAFMGALVLIYGLIVWEFKNFKLGWLIMAPIPLTLIGVIPGHWFTGSEFTATSMIGFIALAGIVVRNSILLVEFVKNEVASGKDIYSAVVDAGQTRLRPIVITALAVMLGSAAILSDPIFRGMAVSLLFGAGVSTVLSLIVIPLGCITARKQFYLVTGVEPPDEATRAELLHADQKPSTPLWMRLWSLLFSIGSFIFQMGRTLVILLGMLVGKLRGGSGGGTPPPAGPAGGTSAGGGGGGAPSPPPAPAPAPGGETPGPEPAEGGTAAAPAESPAAPVEAAETESAPELPASEPKKKATRKKGVRKKKPAARKKVAARASGDSAGKGGGEAQRSRKGVPARKRRGIRLKGGLQPGGERGDIEE